MRFIYEFKDGESEELFLSTRKVSREKGISIVVEIRRGDSAFLVDGTPIRSFNGKELYIISELIEECFEVLSDLSSKELIDPDSDKYGVIRIGQYLEEGTR